MSAGKKTTAVPTTVHCDHLITAEVGATEDLKKANSTSFIVNTIVTLPPFLHRTLSFSPLA